MQGRFTLHAAIGRAELFLQVEALAYTDPLTEVANRRVLEEALERACTASSGGDTPALLLCDIDGLKAINDNFGHDAGDRTIIRVAAALTEAAAGYPGAVVARIERFITGRRKAASRRAASITLGTKTRSPPIGASSASRRRI